MRAIQLPLAFSLILAGSFSANSQDLPSLTATATPSRVAEGGRVEIEIVASKPVGEEVRVFYRTADGTASAGKDYRDASSEFSETFGSGETERRLSASIEIADDLLDEEDETFSIVAWLTDAQGGFLEERMLSVTIVDDDEPPVLTTTVSPSEIVEGGTVTVSARLSAPSGKPVSARVEAVGGSAVAGEDFGQPETAILNFMPGETTPASPAFISIVEDDADEPDEEIFIALMDPQNAALGENSAEVVWISANAASPPPNLAGSNAEKIRLAAAALDSAGEADLEGDSSSGNGFLGTEFALDPSGIWRAEPGSGEPRTISIAEIGDLRPPDPSASHAEEVRPAALAERGEPHVDGGPASAASGGSRQDDSQGSSGPDASYDGISTGSAEGEGTPIVLASANGVDESAGEQARGERSWVGGILGFLGGGGGESEGDEALSANRSEAPVAAGSPPPVAARTATPLIITLTLGPSRTNTTVSEGDNARTRRVALSAHLSGNPPPEGVFVTPVILPGTAGNNVSEIAGEIPLDYRLDVPRDVVPSVPAGELAFNQENERRVDFVVEILDDTLDEEDMETFEVVLRNPRGGDARLGDPSSVRLTIMDDDAPPTVTFEQNFPSASINGYSEGTSATYEAVLSGPSERTVSVKPVIENRVGSGIVHGETIRFFDPVTAANDADHDLNPDAGGLVGGKLVWNPGDPPVLSGSELLYRKSFTVPITSRDGDENRVEQFVMKFDELTNVTASSTAEIVSQIFDMNPTPFLRLDVDKTIVPEGEKVTATVNLMTSSEPTAGYFRTQRNVCVAYGLHNNRDRSLSLTSSQMAASESDVQLLQGENLTVPSGTRWSGILVFEPGEYSKQFEILALADTDTMEIDEVFRIALGGPLREFVYPARPSHSARPGEGLYSGELACENSFPPTPAWTRIGASPVHATLGEKETYIKSVTIQNSEASTLPVASLSASPNPVDEGSTVTVTVTLDKVNSSGVTVTPEIANISTAGIDYTISGLSSGSLTFGASETTKTFTITAVNDTIHEADESFSVSIGGVGALNGATPGTTTSQTVTIRDNDTAPSLTLAIAENSVVEGETATATAMLSAASGRDTTFTVDTTGDTATEGDDYAGITSRTVTIAASQTTANIDIATIDDMIDEATETFSVAISSPEGATISGSSISADVMITDNDDPPSVMITPASVSEGDGSPTFTATLSEASGRDVMVNIATSNGTAIAGSDYASKSETLMFADGATTQTFTIGITEDTSDEPNETFMINITGVNGTAGSSTHTVTIEDNDDPPTLTLSVVPESVAEDAGKVVARVALSAASGNTVTVNLGTADGTAVAGASGDYDAVTSRTLTFSPGTAQLTQDVDIVIRDDSLDEDNETFTVSLSGQTNATLGTTSSKTVTIEDNDTPPTLTLGVAPTRVAEGGGQVVATVSLNPASGRDVSVQIATSDITATAGQDYEAVASSTLTFSAGDTTRTVNIAITDDSVVEEDETFSVALSGESNATLATSTPTTVTIEDNDTRPTVTLTSVAPATVTEDGGRQTVVVKAELNVANSGSDVTVSVDAVDETAKVGEDYEDPTAVTLRIPMGQTTGTADFPIEISSDDLYEGDETFRIELSSPTGATPGSTVSMPVTISDADSTPVVTLQSVTPSTVAENSRMRTFAVAAELDVANALRDVTVTVDANDGTATVADDDFDDPTAVTLTIPKASKTGSANINVMINADNKHEGNETFNIVLSGPVGATLGTTVSAPVTIEDGDGSPVVTLSSVSPVSVSEDVGMQRFAVTARLDVANATGAVTVMVDAADGTATVGEDYMDPAAVTLTIPKDTNSATANINVPIIQDTLDEDSETFDIELSSPTGATLGSATSGQVTITDDDDEPALTLEVTSATVAENGTFSVMPRLSTMSGRDVTFKLETSTRVSDTAIAGVDYVTYSQTLTIAAGETTTASPVSIHTSDDNLHENAETFTISLSDANNASLGTPSSVELTITDNDDAPTVRITADANRVTEGGSVTVTATLSAISGLEVRGTPNLTDVDTSSTDYELVAADLDSGVLVIPAGRISDTFRINAIADGVDEDDEDFTIALDSLSGATKAAGASDPTVTIVDSPSDTAPALTLSVDNASVAEGGKVTATVTLSATSGREVRARPAIANVTAENEDYALVSSTLSAGEVVIDAGDRTATFEINIINDALDEDEETFRLSLTSLAGASSVSPATLDVTILEDNSDNPPTLSLSVDPDPPTIVEGTSSGNTVRATPILSAASGRDVTFNIATANGTAIAGQDYNAIASRRITITAGSTAGTAVTVSTIPDAADEEDENFTIAVSGEINANLHASDYLRRITIQDDDDEPTVTLAVSKDRANEGETVTVTATLSGPSGKAITIPVAITPNTAVAGDDYAVSGLSTGSTVNLQIAGGSGETSASFDIELKTDGKDENEEDFKVSISASSATNARVVSTIERTVTILDGDDAPMASLVLTDTTYDEGETLTATVELSAESAKTIRITPRFTNVTTSSADYVLQTTNLVSGRLEFAPGDTTKTFEVEIVEDDLDEADTETFMLWLETFSDVSQSPPVSIAITINDHSDDTPPTASLEVNPATVTEGETVEVTVTLSERSGRNVSAEPFIRNGNTSHDDYSLIDSDLAGGRLAIPAGQTAGKFRIMIVHDRRHEPTEHFAVTLTSLVGAELGDPSEQEVTIQNHMDDVRPTLTLEASSSGARVSEGRAITVIPRLSRPSGRAVTFSISTRDGTAEADDDYIGISGRMFTITRGRETTDSPVEISIVNDSLDENEETFTVEIERDTISDNAIAGTSLGQEITILEDNADAQPTLTLAVTPSSSVAEGGTVTARARLDGASGRNVSVSIATRDGTAIAGEDYEALGTRTLNIAAGETESSAESIAINDDSLDENDENMVIALSSPRNARLGTPSSRTMIINDGDDLPTVTLELVASSGTQNPAGTATPVNEGESVEFRVGLDPVSGRTASVAIGLADITTDSGDYSVSGLAGGRAVFQPGETEKIFSVAATRDGKDEISQETLTVALEGTPENARIGSSSNAYQLAIQDLDGPPEVILAVRPSTVSEGGTVTVTANLRPASGKEVTVDVSTEDDTATAGEDYVGVVSRRLVIPPGSATAENPLFVATINDGLEELTETFSVRLDNEREAVLGNPQVLEVSIQDGDDPILEPVSDFLMARAGAMLQNLPRLIPMLRDPGHAKLSNLSLEAREGGETRIQGEFRQGGFWADVNASWTGLRSGEHRLALGAIGFHGQPSDNFILGGMMQFDATRTEIANSGGWVEGTGWMFGPYFAAGGPNQSLYAEGRLLWGQSENEILFRGRHGGPDRRGTFETERILAQGRLEGQIPVAGGSRVIPLADLSHVRERAKSFVDDQGRTVPEQTIRQSQIQLGAELDVPIDMASGALNFRPGVRVVGSNQDGGEFGESRQDVMGRFDLGLDYYLGSSVSLSFDGYYSGIGLGKFSGYGVGLDLQIDF